MSTAAASRESDMKSGGAEDRFYFYDSVTKAPVQASQTTLALEKLDPALEGEFEVQGWPASSR